VGPGRAVAAVLEWASGAGRWGDHRLLVQGLIFRYRSAVACRDLPGELGPWQTVWKRHRRFAGDGTWNRVLAVLLSEADSRGLVDWNVSVDCTVKRATGRSSTRCSTPQ